MRKVKKWTPKEEEKLKMLAEDHATTEICSILNRSYNSVISRLKELGIKPVKKACRWGAYEDITNKYFLIQDDLYEKKYTYEDLSSKYNLSIYRLHDIIYKVLDWEENDDVPIPPVRKKRKKD